MTPEGKIKKKLTTMLKKHKVWYFPPQAGAFGSAGIPDIVGCVDGLFFAVECKSGPGKKPTDLQKAVMSKIVNAGGTCFLAFDDTTIKFVEDYIISVRAKVKLLQGSRTDAGS